MKEKHCQKWKMRANEAVRWQDTKRCQMAVCPLRAPSPLSVLYSCCTSGHEAASNSKAQLHTENTIARLKSPPLITYSMMRQSSLSLQASEPCLSLRLSSFIYSCTSFSYVSLYGDVLYVVVITSTAASCIRKSKDGPRHNGSKSV